MANPSELCLVTEYCQNGSLEKFLKTHANIPKKLKIRWIQEIAMGMYHLIKVGIIHRDLAARNILLDANHRPKVSNKFQYPHSCDSQISDFGLARFVQDTTKGATTKDHLGAVKWISPETLLKRQYSEKSDVWSYGVVCHEIIFQQEPYPDWEAAFVAAKVLGAERQVPEIPDDEEYPVIADMMRSCFRWQPELRPSFLEICKLLDEVKEEEPLVVSVDDVTVVYN